MIFHVFWSSFRHFTKAIIRMLPQTYLMEKFLRTMVKTCYENFPDVHQNVFELASFTLFLYISPTWIKGVYVWSCYLSCAIYH